MGSKLTWWKEMEVSGSHWEPTRACVRSRRELLGVVGSHWESLGAVGISFPTQPITCGFPLCPITGVQVPTPSAATQRWVPDGPHAPQRWPRPDLPQIAFSEWCYVEVRKTDDE